LNIDIPDRSFSTPPDRYSLPSNHDKQTTIRRTEHPGRKWRGLRAIYLEPGLERPVNYTFEPPPGVPWNTGVLAPQRVTFLHNPEVGSIATTNDDSRKIC
jgi:hypothetical protein